MQPARVERQTGWTSEQFEHTNQGRLGSGRGKITPAEVELRRAKMDNIWCRFTPRFHQSCGRLSAVTAYDFPRPIPKAFGRESGKALLAIALVTAYANHFQNSFHFDDAHTVVNNAAIRELRNIPLFFWDPSTFRAINRIALSSQRSSRRNKSTGRRLCFSNDKICLDKNRRIS